jgi:hypothetical protein
MGNYFHIRASISSFTIWTSVWVLTVEIFRIWTIFISPIVFNNDHTLENFGSADLFIVITVTFGKENIKMFVSDAISKIDLTIIVGIISHHKFISKINNIETVPFTFTFWFWWDWTVTIEISTFWTVFKSPGVFSDDKTGVEFTTINSSIIIGITVRT